MRIDKRIILTERRRSARFVSIVYAGMALAFSATALALALANDMLGIPVDTASFMAAAFVTLAAANIVVLEAWLRLFSSRA